MSETTPTQAPLIGYASLRDFDTSSFARRVRRLLVRQFVRASIGVGMLAAFVGLFLVFQLGPLSGALGLLACFLSTAIAAGCLRSARRQRAMLVLSYCEQGARLHAPLPDFLRALAMNETPRMSRRLISISESLEASVSLGAAIASELPELPSRIGELLRVAESSGTLIPTLARLVREQEPLDPDRSSRGPMSRAYLAVTLLALALPANMILIFVLPKLASIYHDFGVPIPSIWANVMKLDPDFGLFLVMVVIVVTVAVLIATLGSNARWIFFRRRDEDRPLKSIFDRALWYLPLVGSAIRDRDWADICQSLTDGLEHHRPLELVLREAAAAQHLNGVTATRVDAWLAGVVQGKPLSTAARSAGVPQVVSGMIGSSSAESDSLAPSFAFLARYFRGRAAQRGAWLAAAAIPAMTLACGAVVATFALSLWVPLARLIDLSNPYPPGL